MLHGVWYLYSDSGTINLIGRLIRERAPRTKKNQKTLKQKPLKRQDSYLQQQGLSLILNKEP